MPGIATIGIYGFDLAAFLDVLDSAEVQVVIDVRQRRGVRGGQYAWANSLRLQAALGEAGIGYRHMKELAPTTELRELQYREDARRGEGKRSRTVLAPEYVRLYTQTILEPADLNSIGEIACETRLALLCVEGDPEACHRSLTAERLQRDWGLTPTHLRPP